MAGSCCRGRWMLGVGVGVVLLLVGGAGVAVSVAPNERSVVAALCSVCPIHRSGSFLFRRSDLNPRFLPARCCRFVPRFCLPLLSCRHVLLVVALVSCCGTRPPKLNPVNYRMHITNGHDEWKAHLDMVIMGIRNMQPYKYLPMQLPYCVFEVRTGSCFPCASSTGLSPVLVLSWVGWSVPSTHPQALYWWT